MEYKKVYTKDSKEFISQFNDYEFDIMFADPPYALGSEVIIRKDGKVDYAKASDFMNKWEMPTGEYWEEWFKQAYRTLKHGGWLIVYGMDRQTLLFKYYASLAGFDEQQSLYWYFISNFPKATSLPLMLDKQAGVQGQRGLGGFNVSGKEEQDNRESKLYKGSTTDGSKQEAYNEPKTELAKKYDGYKYSVAPLKQTCETIMVFKKPNKTGSVLHDTLAFENGDITISVSALNIDDNRVGTEVRTNQFAGNTKGYTLADERSESGSGFWKQGNQGETETTGRYPAQTFVDEQVAQALDLQSGISGGGEPKQNSEISRKGMKDNAPAFNSSNSGIDVNKGQGLGNYGDTGGCSKILHKIKYELNEHDLFIYEPKVGEAERNNGLDSFELKPSASSEFRPNHTEKANNGENGNPYGRWKPLQNNHPTLKPIDLNAKILKLFKTPNEQKICYPFAGSGSEILGGLQAGFSQWVACELNQDYVNIANARIKHYQENEYVEIPLFEI
jgi:site-specific DNA-methyltransferase (adenine-specific)